MANMMKAAVVRAFGRPLTIEATIRTSKVAAEAA
jgi:hypothetical protein